MGKPITVPLNRELCSLIIVIGNKTHYLCSRDKHMTWKSPVPLYIHSNSSVTADSPTDKAGSGRLRIGSKPNMVAPKLIHLKGGSAEWTWPILDARTQFKDHVKGIILQSHPFQLIIPAFSSNSINKGTSRPGLTFCEGLFLFCSANSMSRFIR